MSFETKPQILTVIDEFLRLGTPSPTPGDYTGDPVELAAGQIVRGSLPALHIQTFKN